MSTKIQVTIGGDDVVVNSRFAGLLVAWLTGRGDYSVIQPGATALGGKVSYAVKDHAPMIEIQHERDIRDEAYTAIKAVADGTPLTPQHYEQLGKAMVRLLREGGTKVPALSATDELRAVQAALPATLMKRPPYREKEERTVGQATSVIARIINILFPVKVESSEFLENLPFRQTADIGSLKSSDIGRLAFLVMQLARHLPSCEVDFVDALLEAAKTEKPV